MPRLAFGNAALAKPMQCRRGRWHMPLSQWFANENRSSVGLHQRKPVRAGSGDEPTVGFTRHARGSVVAETVPSTVMEWTNDKVCQLIELYRDKPVLWDCRLKGYKDRNKKQDALQEIADVFGVDKAVVEKKIKNLVCHFLREIKKERDSSKSGAGNSDVYKSKWFCYNNMLFLQDRNTPNETTDTITQDEHTNKDGDTANQSQTVNQDQVAGPSGETPRKRVSLPKEQSDRPGGGPQKKKKTTATEEALSIMRSIQGRHKGMDQFKSFGEQVGLRIKDLPSSNAQKIAKHLISNILFEAEMGKYDYGNPIGGSYSQPFYPTPNYVQQPISVPMPPACPNPNPCSEQLSFHGITQANSPDSVISSSLSTHTDNDSIDNILMHL
ncbi:uncharacterized protein LOC124372360 [Homalodisca vitripennis]|uniref:uncharacterized protein LOC124352859 n=1 Tax=Homalodisca vitripennis TaxID=197043 RepID=UPI001EEBCB34|nr:uncharacterized protein LOC124352859 [Homalodisca vitripennis]XP_046658962.1 uncharacterized protein LOC124353145 [Homalodisca vitripennis]XP_046665763.1 uncharacterized protein LOC124357769 [Homalodisca vitripennis]XP_046686698.1 uncharacterized protein LOC124372360 [Homalodisca vitripennis]KAG8332140.1 hypothetical protein J6590_028128 [Homalodisca vitripennis]